MAKSTMSSEVTAQVDPSAATIRRNAELSAFFDALYRWIETKPRPVPVYQRGLETRANIVASARRAFVRLGYIDCTVEDILNEASISRGTFYSHFRSKKAVFAAVVELHIIGRIDETDVADLDDFDYRNRVRETISRFLKNYADTQDFGMVIEQAAHYDPAFRAIRMMIRDIFVRRMTYGIEQQQRLGAASTEFSAELLARTILSMLTNVAQMEIGWRGKQPNDEILDTLTHFWCAGIGLKRRK